MNKRTKREKSEKVVQESVKSLSISKEDPKLKKIFHFWSYPERDSTDSPNDNPLQ